jgi:hypothetical protein
VKRYIITESEIAEIWKDLDYPTEMAIQDAKQRLLSLPALPTCPDCAAKDAEIEWLIGEYREAIRIIKQGKVQFAPDTTNSDADMFLRRAALKGGE